MQLELLLLDVVVMLHLAAVAVLKEVDVVTLQTVAAAVDVVAL